MLREVIEYLILMIEKSGIPTTADTRNIGAPCAFVTVTKLDRPTLAGGWRATGDIILIARDLGGMDDIDALSDLIDRALDVLEKFSVEIETIDTNHQATPPTGGTLPAVRMTYHLYVDREEK